MSTLNQWLWKRSSATLIYNPRLVRQIVGQSPIDGPTEVDIARISHKTDCGTKRNLYDKKNFTENSSTADSYSLKMKSPLEMRHIVFDATSICTSFDNWNPWRCSFWHQFLIEYLKYCCEYRLRCCYHCIEHHQIVQVQCIKLTGHRWWCVRSLWKCCHDKYDRSPSNALVRLIFCARFTQSKPMLARNALNWTKKDRITECRRC